MSDLRRQLLKLVTFNYASNQAVEDEIDEIVNSQAATIKQLEADKKVFEQLRQSDIERMQELEEKFEFEVAQNEGLEARCKELEGDKLALQILASELDKTIQVRAKTINELENKLEEIRINGDY